MTQENIFNQIRKDISNNKVMLYMKGTPALPMCGFSGVVVKILNTLNVEFASCNVMENNDIREGIKAFSSWPTIPQLYIKGEFIGGCDITREMFQSGELQELLKQKGVLK